MKKEKETKKATISANEVLADFAEDTKGLLQTSLGTKKSSIYRESLFDGCTEKQKRQLRVKFRKVIVSTAKSIIAESNKEKQQKLILSFNKFYQRAYKVNDYSLSSICNENLSSEKKDILQKALNICKK